MDSFTLFGYSVTWLDVIVLFCTLGYGAYMVYIGICLKRKKCIVKSGLLIPKGRKEEECIAPEAYISFLKPRLLCTGTLVILLGIFNFFWPMIVSEFSLPYMLGLVGIAPILAVLLLFNFMLRRAYCDYWP